MSRLRRLAHLAAWRQSCRMEQRRSRQLQAGLHRQLDELVRQRTVQLAELTLHLQTAREDERQRLARDLHDELGALLTSAKLDAARIKARLSALPAEPAVALERLAHLVATLNSGIAMKRRIIEDLRPSALAHLGLLAALDILCHEFADSSGLQVHSDLRPVGLGEASALVLYRALQEALTNIAKHAQARSVWVSLQMTAGPVPGCTARQDFAELCVRDDGCGFDSSARRGSAYGLLGMRFRVEAEQGQLSLRSRPGEGSTLRVVLPGRES
ncbi:sensor histidine kinase [Roseateles sp.]|uniref:sensor histidine kinase n=1 Tax=Roseateles sp. TaxID=1971397 RepID=UPI003D14ECE7